MNGTEAGTVAGAEIPAAAGSGGPMGPLFDASAAQAAREADIAMQEAAQAEARGREHAHMRLDGYLRHAPQPAAPTPGTTPAAEVQPAPEAVTAPADVPGPEPTDARTGGGQTGPGTATAPALGELDPVADKKMAAFLGAHEALPAEVDEVMDTPDDSAPAPATAGPDAPGADAPAEAPAGPDEPESTTTGETTTT
jgi:hypothetical protein